MAGRAGGAIPAVAVPAPGPAVAARIARSRPAGAIGVTGAAAASVASGWPLKAVSATGGDLVKLW